MMIIPACCLSASDLALLGNNVLPPRTAAAAQPRLRRGGRREHDRLDAVNRSLAGHGEGVARLYRGTPYVGAADGRAQSAA
jgi:hypothetical protein